ncbi:GatB/YqeY domain-containing protein [Olivibacter sitiensis]|uniref:GatB/YqeY domain-containing protein n=1 Tax=Olivibacter sitiensis TaxID=376470 RepID=UPI0004863283|nr:GatB/YqeY domain-containing protein [Olivibacter sitiensis]
MSLQETINADLKAAMLAKNEVKVRGLRAIKAALLLAATEKGAAEGLGSDTEMKVLQKLVKQRKESAEIYQQQNRQDLYQIEKEEQEVIEQYLPQQLDSDEIARELEKIIASVGASSIKDMGKVMGIANKALAGRADGKTVSELVKKLLNK